MDALRIHGLHIQSEAAQAGTRDSRKIEVSTPINPTGMANTRVTALVADLPISNVLTQA